LIMNAVPELARLGISSNGDVLTLAGGLPTWATPAASGAWTSAGSDVQAGSVSDLTVASIPAHDVLQVVFSVAQDAGSTNTRPCIRINGLTGTGYDSLYVASTASVPAAGYAEQSEAQWEIAKIISGCTFSGTFYIYSPNTNLTTGSTDTMMRGMTFNNDGADITHMLEFCGSSSNTSAITSVTLFFEQDDHTAEDIRGSLQVNYQNY